MAAPHYTYLMLKMPGPHGTITIKGDFELSNTCDKEFQKMAQIFGIMAEYARLRGDTYHNILPNMVRSLPDESAFIEFLHEHGKIFAWCPTDMRGFPRELAEQALNVDPKARPVKQPL
jgi:hypothetical protein